MSRPKPFAKDLTHGNWYTISKLQAAKSQLNSAIQLYFNDDDPISIHTLASAAVGIIDALLAAKGIPITTGEVLIKPEYREQWAATLKEEGNFFKHARKDPHETIHFKDDLNLVMLMRGAGGYLVLTDRLTMEMSAFKFWMYIRHPKKFVPTEAVALLTSLIPMIDSVGKKNILEPSKWSIGRCCPHLRPDKLRVPYGQ